MKSPCGLFLFWRFFRSSNLVAAVRTTAAPVEPAAPRAILIAMPGFLGGGPSFDGIARSVVELYAAWRFESDDKRGFDQLAGMIFLDGLMGDTPSAEEDFGPELASIRETDRYTTLPLLGIDVYTSAEIVATLGLAFDSMHQPLSFSRTTLGTLTGGPTEDFTFPLAGDDVLQRPSDPDATYDWIDAFDSDPQEFTPARNLARSFTIGESNFAEWYFPQRISLDAGAARGGPTPSRRVPRERSRRHRDRSRRYGPPRPNPLRRTRRSQPGPERNRNIPRNPHTSRYRHPSPTLKRGRNHFPKGYPISL